MLLDKQLLVADAMSLNLGTGTTVATNVIDLGAAVTDTLGKTVVSDIGRTKGLSFWGQINTTVTSGGAGTAQFQIITSAAANMSSPTVIATTQVLALATMVAGYQFRLEYPPGIAQQYLSAQVVIATAALTGGTFSAGLVETRQTNPSVG